MKKMLITILSIRKWLFCASLILFATLTFYIFIPKWDIVFVVNKIEDGFYTHIAYRFNKVTGKLQKWDIEHNHWIDANKYQFPIPSAIDVSALARERMRLNKY